MSLEHRPTYRFDEFRLDTLRGMLRGPGGAEVPLRPKGYALLRYLVERPGVLHTREALLDVLWPGVVVTDDSLTQCVSDLRRALGDRAGAVLRTLPRRGYVLATPVRREDAAGPEPKAVTPAPAAQPVPAPRNPQDDRRDVLIFHPVESPAGDATAAQTAQALTAELVGEIARFEGVILIAEPAAFVARGYRLRCELRLIGPGLRLSARLEDAASDAVLWAHREQADAGPVPPAGLVPRLATLVDRQIERQALLKARAAPPHGLTARELYLLGRDHHQRGTEIDTRLARDLLDRAIQAAPDFALPYAWQAAIVQRAITLGWGTAGGQDARDLTLALARRAVELAPDSPFCLSRFAFALLLGQHWEPAVDAARAALSAWRPAGRNSRDAAGLVLAHTGHPEEAAQCVEQGIAADPPGFPTSHAVLGRALLLAGHVEEALPKLRWCAAQRPDFEPTYHSLVVAGVETGRIEEARAALREVVRLHPGWRPRNHTGQWYFRYERDADRFQAAFQAAGWAELAA